MSVNKTIKDSNRLVNLFIKKLNMSGIRACSENSISDCDSLHIIKGVKICTVPYKRK